jgi:hypothetical protein
LSDEEGTQLITAAEGKTGQRKLIHQCTGRPPATKREGHLLPKSAQATSNALACEANQLTQHRTLAGWFTMTRRIAPRYVRIETRRQRRESDAHVYPNGKVLASSSHPSKDVTRSEGLSPVDTVSPKAVLAETGRFKATQRSLSSFKWGLIA